MKDKKCKICRRLGAKLFLKGEKCLSPKCPMIRKSYPPGIKGKRKTRAMTEYGKESREKQKLKNWYGLGERQFKKYVKEVLVSRGKVEDASIILIQKLEGRLDNVIFRLGFANSRAQTRQLVNHGHFLVNGKKVNIPSYQLKKGDKITSHPSFKKSKFFQDLQVKLKKHQPPSWLSLNPENLEAEVKNLPTSAEAAPPAEISTIFEYYSR